MIPAVVIARCAVYFDFMYKNFLCETTSIEFYYDFNIFTNDDACSKIDKMVLKIWKTLSLSFSLSLTLYPLYSLNLEI